MGAGVDLPPLPVLRHGLGKGRGPRPHLQLGARLAPGAPRAQGSRAVHRRPGRVAALRQYPPDRQSTEEHTSKLQSIMRISYAVFRFKKKFFLLKYDFNNTT